jgi:hypothetical protein
MTDQIEDNGIDNNGVIDVTHKDVGMETQTTTVPPLITTKAREFLSPFLPPPVVLALHQIDARLEPYLGREASMNLVATTLAGMMVLYLVKNFINARQRSHRKAWADDTEEEGGAASSWSADVDYGSTVILCGPPGGGKTTLFCHLCPEALPPGLSLKSISTLTSLRPNLGLSTTKPTHQDEQKHDLPRRVIDYPGHMSLQDDSFLKWLFPKSSPSAPTRVILVVDATQRVSPAAQTLYQLLELAAAQRKPQSNAPRLEILIACHKTEAAQAKNWRRIKLQIRTELERRFAQKTGMDYNENVDVGNKTISNDHPASTPWWWPQLNDKTSSTTWDLEQLPVAQISFCSSTCHQDGNAVGLSELLAFCGGSGVAASTK